VHANAFSFFVLLAIFFLTKGPPDQLEMLASQCRFGFPMPSACEAARICMHGESLSRGARRPAPANLLRLRARPVVVEWLAVSPGSGCRLASESIPVDQISSCGCGRTGQAEAAKENNQSVERRTWTQLFCLGREELKKKLMPTDLAANVTCCMRSLTCLSYFSAHIRCGVGHGA